MDFNEIDQNNAPELTYDELQAHCKEYYNLSSRKKTFDDTEETKKYDCEICKDKGFIWNNDGFVICRCAKKKQSRDIAIKSGLAHSLAEFKFDNFETSEKFQLEMFQKAKAFCEDNTARWFFFGGQSGTGKTHLCTAICNHFINDGTDTKYIFWNEFSSNLKTLYTKPDEYRREIDRVKDVDLLYVDDLFKGCTYRGTQPTDADVKLAFEIFNHRFLCADKVTIISTEWFISELLEIDEATFSRVYQKCGKYKFDIARDKKRNYRLK